MLKNTMALACAAAAVAGVLIAIGACAAWAIPLFRPLPLIWCFVPLAWCLWSMLAPSSWVPAKLPMWGALLGVIAWLFAGMILDLPARLLDIHLSAAMRMLLAVPAIALYYLLWMAVRAVYIRMAPKA